MSESRLSITPPFSNPSPDEIKKAREAGGLSQTAAAKLVYSGLRTWQQWEAGDRKMHPGLWELFRIKIAVRDDYV